MKLKRFSRSNSSDSSRVLSLRRQKIRRSQFKDFEGTDTQLKRNEAGPPADVPPSQKHDTSVKGSNNTRITVKMIPSKETQVNLPMVRMRDTENQSLGMSLRQGNNAEERNIQR